MWLNPLLRYERFEPRAAGIRAAPRRAMLPHVDRFVPAHNPRASNNWRGCWPIRPPPKGRATEH